MQKIANNLYVGNQQDYEAKFFDDTFSFLLAAKEPWHREMLGYKAELATSLTLNIFGVTETEELS